MTEAQIDMLLENKQLDDLRDGIKNNEIKLNKSFALKVIEKMYFELLVRNIENFESLDAEVMYEWLRYPTEIEGALYRKKYFKDFVVTKELLKKLIDFGAGYYVARSSDCIPRELLDADMLDYLLQAARRADARKEENVCLRRDADTATLMKPAGAMNAKHSYLDYFDVIPKERLQKYYLKQNPAKMNKG